MAAEEFSLDDLMNITGESKETWRVMGELGIRDKRSFGSDDVVAVRRALTLPSGGRRGGGGSNSRKPASNHEARENR
jgi:hypothetical protein